MSAAPYKITIEQGVSWPDSFIADEPWISLTDDEGAIIPLSGWTGVMSFSESHDHEPFLTLTTENGGMVIDGPKGGVSPMISDDATAALSVYKGVYDLKLINPDGKSIGIIYGPFTVRRGF